MRIPKTLYLFKTLCACLLLAWCTTSLIAGRSNNCSVCR